MSDMTGWQLAEVIRALPELAATRIVMVSANAHEYMQGGSERSHDAFVMKPVSLQVLLEHISALLKLEWIYDTSHPETIVASPTTLHLTSQTQQHVDALLQLGRIGHVRGIQAKLREIEAEDAANQPFVTQLRGMVTHFDMKRYMSTLEAMKHNA
jgi:CheY-like chemotaxis protein